MTDGTRWFRCIDGGWGFVDSEGFTIQKCYFESVSLFKNERAIVAIKSHPRQKYGVINKKTLQVIPCEFDSIQQTSADRFKVFFKDENFVLDEYGGCKEGKEKRRRYKESFFKDIK